MNLSSYMLSATLDTWILKAIAGCNIQSAFSSPFCCHEAMIIYPSHELCIFCDNVTNQKQVLSLLTNKKFLLQALSEFERKHWVEALGGTWPAVNTLQRIRADSVEDNLNRYESIRGQDTY